MAMNGVEQTLQVQARRLALKGPMRAVKLTPGRHQVKTLKGQWRDRATSL
jgi:hypothetical protein